MEELCFRSPFNGELEINFFVVLERNLFNGIEYYKIVSLPIGVPGKWAEKSAKQALYPLNLNWIMPAEGSGEAMVFLPTRFLRDFIFWEDQGARDLPCA